MKRMKDVLAADILRVTATITKSLKAAFLICGIVLLGCQNEFIVATTAVEEVMPTDVVVDSLVQPSETVQLDVLVVLDTSVQCQIITSRLVAASRSCEEISNQ